ncbi:MAG: amidohydrolase family protein [Eubacteriaceae bacterium]|nr:amidohydrolase family protein [Eubacteriaceae bacterium]
MFIETHMHIALNGVNAEEYKRKLMVDLEKTEDLIRKSLSAYKTRGIIAVRDGGDSLGLFSLARKIAEEEGIIYKTPVQGIFKKGFYGSMIGQPVEDMNDFKSYFRKLMKHKPDFIKIILTGMMSFKNYGYSGETGFDLNELKSIVDRAKDKGLPVMIHANTKDAVQMAIKCKVDTIEHGYYITEEELQGMKEEGIIWVPTLAPLGNIIYSNDVRYKNEVKTIRRIFEEQSEMVKKGYDLGVKIAVGSDSGAYRVYHGSGFFDELIYLNKAGIRKKELMVMAHKNGLEALNITQEEIDAANDKLIDES